MREHKRILFFIQSQEVGGVETQLIDLLSCWPDKEDRFTIWCNRSYKGREFYLGIGLHCEVIGFPTISEMNAAVEAARLPVILKRIFKVGVRLTKHITCLASVVFFCRKLQGQKFDIVVSDNGGYPAAELCLSLVIASRLSGIEKTFLMVHSCPSPRRFPFQLLDRVLDVVVSWACSEIITISNACAGQLEKFRFHGRKLRVIYNGISCVQAERMSLTEKRKVLGISDHAQVVGLIGDYEPLKGHESLMRAFVDIATDHPLARLVFIGSDAFEHAKHLKDLVKILGIEGRVIFTGYLKDARQYIECFDVLVLPSVAYEGFGIVLLEAMLYQKPVVGTKMGGIPEVIGDAGFLVKANAPMELSVIIGRLLRDPGLCREFGEKGFLRLKSHFTATRMAQEYYTITRLLEAK